MNSLAPGVGRFSELSKLWTACLLLVVLAVGCNQNEFGLVPVSGVVTFDGGPCPKQGSISFSPMELAEGLPTRPASARFQEDGKFEVTSFKPGDGLMPGTYKIRISCVDGIPDINAKDPLGDITLIAKDYKQPDPIVIEPGSGPVELKFDVPAKKGRK